MTIHRSFATGTFASGAFAADRVGATSRQRVGSGGEDLACDYLQGLGWEVLDRNWRCQSGEIDLVAAEPVAGRAPVIVFVEVKCRTGLGYGSPLEAITVAKLDHLRAAAGAWLAAHRSPSSGVRLDAISVLKLPGQAPRLEHTKGLS